MVLQGFCKPLMGVRFSLGALKLNKMKYNEKLEVFINRLSKIGIKVEYFSNYPWIYIDKINGKQVIDRFYGNHGFTIMFVPIRGSSCEFTDIGEIFKLIRKYI